MQADDPPYLSVGTAVSAKYKGAFCEAKVSKVVRLVKCKVTYKMGLGNSTLTDEQIKGTLRVGQLVQAKHPDRKELVEANITKIQDCSQYTVVFDDGDITTLRRTALCLKSGRHFNESETLDQLPLTHPEHFGNPVVGGRRGRRNRQPKVRRTKNMSFREDSSDGEVEEENEPDLEAYLLDLKRVVSVETTEKKRSKDNWFPGLVVIPSAQPTVRINMKDEYLIRSFQNGRYYTVPKKEVTEFNRDLAEKLENSVLAEAIQKAIRFLDHNELPPHWEKSSLFHSHNVDSESDENFSDSSDDEPSEEKDRFVAQLYKFMDEAGTPLNKTPTISNQDIDLHRLFGIVQKMGGCNRVTNQNKWRTVTLRLHLPGSQNIFNQVKAVYKKCLSSYETFYRTLGVTMLNHTRPTKKNKGRSLIRDRDRSTPISSPASAPEKDEPAIEEKKEVVPVKETPPQEPLKSKRIEKKRALALASAEISDTNSSDTTDQPEPLKDTPRPKRERVEKIVKEKEKDKEKEKEKEKEKKIKIVSEKIKNLIEKFEEPPKKEEEEKVQNTRSKAQSNKKEPPPPVPEKRPELKPVKENKPIPVKPIKKPVPPTPTEEEKKKGKKRPADEKPATLEGGTADKQTAIALPIINIGDKLKVFYGTSTESKVTYEAKVIEIDKDQTGQVYLVHYTGWNTRYDEWIQPQRIAENLSATKKAKRSKQPSTSSASSTKSQSQTPKPLPKRARVTSVSARSSTTEIPRSTTPSSVTSSGSRTKSPATPATRSAARLRQDSTRRTRRISAQTDISTHTESDSEGTGSDSEVSRTRSRSKSENEPEIKTYRRRPPRAPVLPKMDKRKDREDGGPPEDIYERTRSRRSKKSSDKSAEESEDDGNPPKGRDFDLNQIRSELKGFSKAIKLPPLDSVDDKEAESSSDECSSPPPLEKSPEITDEPIEKKEKPLEKSSSSEDVYEFKEPEPFEFENRPKLGDEKKRLVTRMFEDVDKTPKLRSLSVPLRKQEEIEDSDEDDEDEEETMIAMSPPKEEEDPFDKLVESPSFNLVKTVDKVVENKEKVVRNICEDSLSLFRDLPPDASDDYSGDMELSDCESPSQIFTTSPEKMASANIFGDSNFSKPSPDQNTLDMEFSSLGKTDEGKNKDSDDEDSIREQIQRVIAQSSSTDDDSGDALAIVAPNLGYPLKRDDPLPTMTGILGINVCEPAFKMEVPEVSKLEETKEEEKAPDVSPNDDKPSTSNDKQHISPALQETDSALLESIVSELPVSLDVKLEETAKELSNVKTGTKIADSILQKFNSIKNEIAAKISPKRESVEKEEVVKDEAKVEIVPPKEEPKVTPEEAKPTQDEKPSLPEPKPDQKSEEDDDDEDEEEEEEDEAEEEEEEEEEIPSPPIEEPIKKPSSSPKSDLTELKKRKKVLSRAYIEDSETDSSDSEQLVIARSDDDSQTTSLDIKPDTKESDSSNIFNQLQTTDESQSQEELNFNFETKKDEVPVPSPSPIEEEVKTEESEAPKEEDPDPHLHSLLICDEEIPRSPAPPSEPPAVQESKMKSSVLEMPFASAPSTSNNKSMFLEQKKMSPAPSVELHGQHGEREREHRVQNSTVLDNTPPTTPESSISNLSPRGDIGGLSPTMGDNESGKSNDIESEYPRQRSSTLKVSPYSEEDTQMMGEMKKPASCKKRRKSLRNSEDTMPLSSKKCRKTRSRHNSDSDDTSEYSNAESTKVSYNRSNRSPRPSKYNFYVEFDPTLDSGQRIAVLQQKLSELRKTYADVKAELAAVERRRKKIRRREREALKAAKQEMACT